MSVPQEVILSPQERYLHLSSEYATETQYGLADCKFRVNTAISSTNDQYCMAVGVHNASIPHTWYNIFGTKFAIYLGYSGVSVIYGEIPRKNYTATTLASAFQTAVNASMVAAGLAATFTVTYNSETNFVTFSNSVVALTPPWYFVYVDDNCYLELGLRNLYTRNTSSVVSILNTGGTAYTLTPSSMLDLSAFHGIYVNLLSQASNAQASYNGLNNASILARIPIRNPFGAVETFEPDNITYVYLPNSSLTDIHIQLTGDDGRLLDLNGVNWTMSLHVKFMAIRKPESQIERLLPVDVNVGYNGFASNSALGGRRVI